MKKIIILSFLLFSKFAYAENIKCGVISALTGAMAKIGSGIKNTVVIADAELDDGNKVEFLYEDDQFIPKNTVSSMRKLLASGVNCVIVFGSTNSLAIADLAERAKVPMISIAITPKVVQGREYVYRLYIPVARQIEVILNEVSKRKYESVAIITTVQDATETLRENFVQHAQVKIKLDEEIAIGDLGVNSIIAKIASLKPSAVFINTLPPQNSIISRQLRALKFSGDFFGGPTLGNLDEIQAAQGTLENSWFVSIAKQGATELYERYKNIYNEDPAPESVYGYDAASIIIQGVKSGNLQEFLSNTRKVKGLLGEYKLENHSFDVPAELWQINGNTWE